VHLRIASSKFLRYLVTQRGIEVTHNQIFVILEMKSPTTIKDVQILNGRLAALNRFLSRSIDKCKPFFLVIKKNEVVSAGTKSVKQHSKV